MFKQSTLLENSFLVAKEHTRKMVIVYCVLVVPTSSQQETKNANFVHLVLQTMSKGLIILNFAKNVELGRIT